MLLRCRMSLLTSQITPLHFGRTYMLHLWHNLQLGREHATMQLDIRVHKVSNPNSKELLVSFLVSSSSPSRTAIMSPLPMISYCCAVSLGCLRRNKVCVCLLVTKKCVSYRHILYEEPFIHFTGHKIIHPVCHKESQPYWM